MAANLAIVQSPGPLEEKGAGRVLQVFSTCPSSSVAGPEDYSGRIAQVARWSESAGCTGILVYTDNSLIDPWLASHIIIQNTRTLSPLVAVQPVYMHPYSVAKMVTTLGFLHHRRIFLNMVAGGFKNDLTALNDTTPHDLRYERLIEYTQIIQQLLEGQAPVTFEGRFYQVRNLALKPALNKALKPGVLMSGSSEAGMAAAMQTGAIAVQYPEPPGHYEGAPAPESTPRGVRIGIITRPREDDAWEVALARFPDDRMGQLTRQLATKVSDSSWHQRLSELGRDASASRDTYWLHPFNNYQTNCPYLVGSYQAVAEQLSRYVELGYRTFILDIPAAQEEFEHTGAVFQDVSGKAGL